MSMADWSPWQFILARSLLALAMAALGAFTAVSFKRISHKGLCLLISFAAGALLTVVLLDMIPETVELVGREGTGLSLAAGYLLFFIVTRFVFHICPACAATHTEAHFRAVTIAMLVALGLHSFMDGLALYSGYMAASSLGLLILIAVAYHKFPEGMALTLVARNSGYSRLKAFMLCVVLEGTTTVSGGLAGCFFISPDSAAWTGYVLGFVAGGFIFLVIHALFSEVIKHHPRSTVLAALGGGASIALAGFLFGLR